MDSNSVRNVFCKKGYKHEGKEILMICLNVQCDAKRLCCLTCIDELHRKHELISLNKFQQMLSVLNQKKAPELKNALIQIVKDSQNMLLDVKYDIFQQVQKVVETFRKQIERCQRKIQDVFELIYSSLNIQGDQQIFQHLYEEFTNEKVCKYLDLIKEAENTGLKSPESALSITKKSEVLFKKSIEECDKLTFKGIDEIVKGIEKLKQSLSQGQSKIKRFSKTNKANCLSINQEASKVERAEGAGGYPIVLFDEPLSQINDNVNVTISEQPGNKGIWMGVCVLDIVKNFNFLSCYGLGKGTWAIDQVGANHQSAYSWNHHDSNYNSQAKVGFQISAGQVVNIRVDFSKSVVIFKRGDASYEQPIKTDLGEVYAFVGPTHLGDSLCIA